MLSSHLWRQAKAVADLSGTNLSSLLETEIRALVRARLPGLLAGLDASE